LKDVRRVAGFADVASQNLLLRRSTLRDVRFEKSGLLNTAIIGLVPVAFHPTKQQKPSSDDVWATGNRRYGGLRVRPVLTGKRTAHALHE
jgi:hypothetical protein